MFNLINKFWGTNETTKTNEPVLEKVTVSKVTANEKPSETKDGPVTVGDVFKIFGKIFMGGAVFLGIDYLTGITGIAGNLLRFGTSRSSSRDDSTALTTYKTGELTPLDKNNMNYDKPLSANNALTKNFLDEEVSSSASEWVEGFKKEKLPVMKIVESATSSSGDNNDKSVIQHKYIGRKLMASEADEPLTLINNTLNIEVGGTVVLTNENLATSSSEDPTNIVYTVSETQHGQFKLVNNGTVVTNFTQQDVNYGKIQFQDDGGFFAPMWKIGVSDGQAASDPEYATVNFVYNCPTKIGHEFQVNTYFIDEQIMPSVANLDDGKFVIVWASNEQDGSGDGVFGQIFNPDGIKYGTELQVNTFTNSNQSQPSVTGLTNGKFVVVWYSDGQDGSSHGVFGQLFYGNGVKYGPEFQINTYINSAQYAPAVAGLTNDKFVVTWHSNLQDGSSWGIYAQIYDNSMKYADEFRVNNHTANYQTYPATSKLINDKFVVVWQSLEQDSSGYGIFGQILYNNGTKYGSEFQANTYTNSAQDQASVTGLTDGKFVVTWESAYQDGSSWGIYAQIFYNNGTIYRYSSEFRVNTYIINEQKYPSAAKLTNDKFVIIWQSNTQDGDDYGVFGQVFYNNGIKYNDEFQVNTYTKFHQSYPSVTGLPDDKFIVTWQSYNQKTNTSLYDIYAQLFSVNNHSPQLINNQLIIQENKISILPSEQLSATDPELPDEEIKFLISDIQHGQFQLLDNETTVEGISDFTQQQITDGKIRFVYTGNYTESALPSYKVSITDGKLFTSPISAKITLTSHNNTTLFIAIGAGAVGLATFAAILAYKIKQKKKHSSQEMLRLSSSSEKGSKIGLRKKKSTIRSMIDTSSGITIHHFEAGDFSSRTERIAEGAFGEVYKTCIRRGKLNDNKKRIPVAIKRLKIAVGDDGEVDLKSPVVKEFFHEIQIMHKLSMMDNKNILKLYGISLAGGYFAVMELMCTSLKDLIHTDKSKPISVYTQFKIFAGVVNGLSFIHHLMNMVHRDMKPANILLAEDNTPKLADFGLTRELSKNMTRGIGTLIYMAPEVLSGGKYGAKADIYSLGLILLELLTRLKPFSAIKTGDIPEAIASGIRPEIPKQCPQVYSNLIQNFWHTDSSQREAMNLVKKRLPAIEKKLRAHYGDNNWVSSEELKSEGGNPVTAKVTV